MATWPTFEKKAIWFQQVGYTPTEAQLPVHQSQARLILIGGGWRGGKSRSTAMEAFGCWHAWDLLYIVGWKYENTLAEFDYLDLYFRLLEQQTGAKLIARRSRPASGQGRCMLELAFKWKGKFYLKRILTISVHNTGPRALTARGEAPDMILLTEFEALPYDVYLAARGRVAEKRGRLILSGTFPDDTGWQAQLWRRWQGANEEGGESFSLPTWSNTVVFPGGRDDPEIKALEAVYTKRDFLRKFGAQPQPPETLVFPEFDVATHVREFVEFDPSWPVEVWVDPGYGESAYAVLAVQVMGQVVFVIDEIHEHGMTGEEIVEMAMNRPWWSNVEGGVIDFAGRQHHANTSQIEIWQAKAGIYLRSQPVPEEAGRERLRSFLRKDPLTGAPRIFFSPKCTKTIQEFAKYQWRRRPEERVAGEKPINQHNDAIKALTYGLVDRFGYVEHPPVEIPAVGPRPWGQIFKVRK